MPFSTKSWKTVAAVALVALAAGGGLEAWRTVTGSATPAGIASGNGRIEAVEIDVAAKTAGRIREILVDEGDFVTAGQILGRIDTAVLEAQRREAEAQLRQAGIGIDTARTLVKQREAEHAAAIAVVAQRKAELDAAQARLARSEQLAVQNNVSRQVLDDDRAKMLGAKATVSAAEAQLAAADAAIGTAKSQVVNAEAATDAARASIQRIQADIDDAVLRSPRDGRVQYRVAQPGEVLAAGGRVLNLVDLGDVYMTFFLPTAAAGRVRLGTEVRLVLDAAAEFVLPAQASFVSDVAQFTPKTVETAEERQKLMFRIKARLDPELLRKHMRDVKTGLPGTAYVRVDPEVQWPAKLAIKVPQ